MSSYSTLRYTWSSSGYHTNPNLAQVIQPSQTTGIWSGAGGPAGQGSWMNVLTDLELVNTSATSYASVNILDGSKTIWGTTLPQATPGSGAAFTSYIMNLSTPIKSSPGNALNITQNGTSGLLQWNAQGYAANSGM